MNHHPGCERAKLHECHCSACGGTLHGWPYSLKLARDPLAGDLKGVRDRVEAAWAATRRPRKGRGASKRRREAATDSATVDLIEWLSEYPRTIDHVQAVGNLLAKDVINELEKTYGRSESRKIKSDLTNHFWCDLLVTLADGMQRFGEAIDRIPDYVITAITKSRKADLGSALLKPLAALAVRTAWEPVEKMIEASGIEELKRTCRILAVLICPAPEDHAAVRDGALIPLAKEAISEISRERLEQVFPADWVSRLRKSLEGYPGGEPATP